MAAWAEGAWADGAWEDGSWEGMGEGDDNPQSLPGGSSRRGRIRRQWWVFLVPLFLKLFDL